MHIRDDQIVIAPLELVDRGSAAVRKIHGPATIEAMQPHPKSAQDRRIIVDEQDLLGLWGAHISSPCSGASVSVSTEGVAGSRITKTVPLPCSVSKVRLPPCRSTITERAIARP